MIPAINNLQNKSLMNGIGIIGVSGAGKTTFMAVNFYLFTTKPPLGYLVEPNCNHNNTANILNNWIDCLNRGDFPDPTINKSELHVNYYKKGKKIDLVDYDLPGEIWDVYNPYLNNSGNLLDDHLNYFTNCQGYLLLIDSSKATEQDTFHHNLIINIKEKFNNERSNLKPIVVVFTKIDKSEEKISNPTEFFRNNMPRTYNQFNFFFQPRNTTPRVFFTRIGKVVNEDNKVTLKNFNPSGFKESLLHIFTITNIFSEN